MYFPNDRAKWEWLQHAPDRDAQNAEIRRIAFLLWSAAAGDAGRFASLAHTVARDWIRYQTDTARVGGEELGTPAAALVRGVDDCDAKARCFVALCRAVGVPAEMRDRWKGDELSHVYAMVRLEGQWFAVELTLARARVGDPPPAGGPPEMFTEKPGVTVPVETTGQWLVT